MINAQLIFNLLNELIAAFIVFTLGYCMSNIPKSIRKYQLSTFLGRSIFQNRFKIVYGIIRRNTEQYSPDCEKAQTYHKSFYNGNTIRMEGYFTIISDRTLQAYSYIIKELARYTESVEIISDEFSNIDLNNSYLSLGGSISNELTYFILNQESNKFFKFTGFMNKPKNEWRVETLDENPDKRSFKRSYSKDYGIILKIKNTRFKNHHFMVCAGLGSWGTSGAAWYLANYWKDLYKEFKSNEFGIIVEVSVGNDTSARRIYPEKA